MTPVVRPVRSEGDDTPRPPMTQDEAEGWLDYWETVGLSSDPTALDEREAARMIRAELKRLRAALQPPVDAEYLSDVERNAVALAAEVGRLRAASAAPETSPDALRAGLRRVLHLEDYESETDEQLLIAAESAYRKAVLRGNEVKWLRGRSATHPETTEH